MSYLGEITFNVYHGGYWVKLHDGELAYLDGAEMKIIQCKPEEILNVLAGEFTEGLNGQKLWYKMPFEVNKERKSLCIGEVNFEKMCLAGKWTGFVDIFLVNTTEHPDDVDGPVFYNFM